MGRGRLPLSKEDAPTDEKVDELLFKIDLRNHNLISLDDKFK